MRQSYLSRWLLALALASLSHAAAAQIPGEYPVIGIAPTADCVSAPNIEAATGYARDPGVYDFFFYPMVYSGYGPFDAVRLGITWPTDWTLQEVEVCYGTVAIGGISGPGSGFTLEFDAVESTTEPAIRMRIDASSEGILGLTLDPISGEFGFRTTDGTWYEYLDLLGPLEPGQMSMYQVVIGELDVCDGPWPLYQPYNFCDLVEWGPGYPGSVAIPPVIDLPAGVVHVDTLNAYSSDCSQATIPECGQWFPGPCLDGASTGVDWLSFDFSEVWGPGQYPVYMTVDTRELEPGTYATRVITDSICDCGVRCYWVELNVGPAAVETTSWGQIKAAYEEVTAPER